MKTFTLARVDGRNHQVPYWPIEVTIAGVDHIFALHMKDSSDYAVSDIRSGASVLRRVHGEYKGMPCTTSGFTLNEVKLFAINQVHNIAINIGAEKFNRVIAEVILDADTKRQMEEHGVTT